MPIGAVLVVPALQLAAAGLQDVPARASHGLVLHLVGVHRDEVLVLSVPWLRLLAHLAAAERPGPGLLGQGAVQPWAGLLEAAHLQRGNLHIFMKDECMYDMSYE